VHALHSAARQYCAARLDALVDIHLHGMPRDMTPEQLAARQGEIALRGILPSIEAALPSEYPNTGVLRLICWKCAPTPVWRRAMFGMIRTESPRREAPNGNASGCMSRN